MMQFSWAPWRVLTKEELQIVKDAADLHKSLNKELIALVRKSEIDGEPILRNLEYNYPNQGYEKIVNEFMVGEYILVAPVITPKTYEREVILPAGTWKESDGTVYEGNKTYTLPCPLNKILWFRKVK
jgi:alpha-glucosidase